ncbi:MAG: bifunctional adenosylcobinamide kinase/adenosylcobinamide-phosphate guanylyltransferase [Kineosporiaceae bacterium]
MELTLLGTGSADGWPNPFCDCRSCDEQRVLPRASTSVLVDGTVLLDCGPETPRQALRAGRSLSGLRVVWVGHAHPDHTSPMAALTRAWAAAAGTAVAPLTIVGPAAAVDPWQPWVGPGDTVSLRPVRAGDDVEVGGYRFEALPAAHDAPGEALLCLVTGPGGARVLYGTDTGALPAATLELLPRSPLDAVLLDETFGTRADLAARGQHLDLPGLGHQVDRLRSHGAVGPATEVVAVHMSHHNPPEPELTTALAAHGARPGRDGETIVLGSPGPRAAPAPATGPPARPPRRVLVLGGARSGKSTLAEQLLADVPDAVYVATGHPADPSADPEWAARVARHRDRRPPGWRTVERLDVAGLLRQAGPPVLVDCLTLWLSRTLDQAGAWESHPGWQKRADAAIADLASAWRGACRTVVAVSNEVGSGVVPATAAGRVFRDLQGRLNAVLAADADDAVLVVAGRALPLPAAGPAPVLPGGGP